MNVDLLEKNGWLETSTSDIDGLVDHLVTIGKKLGNPIKSRKSIGLAQRLVPAAREESFPNSLSSKYSSGGFPLHVDTAHWSTPCRYLILGCYSEGQSNRKTTLLDYSHLDITDSEKRAMFNAPFNITSGRSSFYGQVLSRSRNFIRFDPGCMTPATKQGETVCNIFSERRIKTALKDIAWEKGKIVIIDNWRILHGREFAMNQGADRVLYRVLVS